MFKMLKFILSLFLIFSIIGCSSSQEKSNYYVSVVVAANSNQKIHDFSIAGSYIEKACVNGGSISTVNVDSNSSYGAKFEITKPISKDSIVNQNKQQIFTSLEQMVADDPEIDLLDGISLGAKEAKGKKSDSNILLIFASGLSSSGYINMAEISNLQSIDISKTIQSLKDESALPDLSSIDKVVWFSLGEVGENQILNAEDKTILKLLWTDLLSEAGVSNIEFCEKNSTLSGCYEEAPYVSQIHSDGFNSVLVSVTDEDIIDLKKNHVYKYKFLFVKNSSELLDEERTSKELSSLANYLNNHKEINISLYGCTAKADTLEVCKKRSLDRCKVIKEILTNQGVSEEQIDAVRGIGFLGPYHVDEWESGVFNEELAQENRCCLIVNSQSEIAKTLNEL